MNAISTTIDPSGRLVIPKTLRILLGLNSGARVLLQQRDGILEISMQPEGSVIRKKGPFYVASRKKQRTQKLTQAMVDETLQSVRNRHL